MVRFTAKNIALEETAIVAPKEDLSEILGAQKVFRDQYENNQVAGVVTGLA